MIRTCSSVASLISLTEQGLGIALLPLPLVEKQLARGSLALINTEIEPLTLDFCCCWRADEESLLPKSLADSATAVMASGK